MQILEGFDLMASTVVDESRMLDLSEQSGDADLELRCEYGLPLRSSTLRFTHNNTFNIEYRSAATGARMSIGTDVGMG